MARKQRDYKAEYAARKARAQAQGFKGYWQQRQQRAGKPVRTDTPRPLTRKTEQANRRAKAAGFRSDYDYRKTRAKAIRQSDAKAQHNSSVYDPSSRPSGMTVAQYTAAYNAAWINRAPHGTQADYVARAYWYQGMWDDYGYEDEYPEWYDSDFDRYSVA